MSNQKTAFFAGAYDHGSLLMHVLTFVSADDLARQLADIQMAHYIQNDHLNGGDVLVDGRQTCIELLVDVRESFDMATMHLGKANVPHQFLKSLEDFFIEGTDSPVQEDGRSRQELAQAIRDLSTKLVVPEDSLFADGQIHLHLLAAHLMRDKFRTLD